ncbi:potassium channel family protein [Streptomyces sp. LX-29]|uniref:potassium channel family protein n=1 Tax=Streptomyces sp. LX-29 TaxID=2900152 RepID=UPI00240DFCBF|nr:potassium channel family protein [Streptomyces sp. LX-29]WFB06583.1 potassium channel family protein [Streptomyces sp. LX-29]
MDDHPRRPRDERRARSDARALSAERTRGWEQRTALALYVASQLFLASYAMRVLAPGLPPFWHTVCVVVTDTCWAVFIVDYVVRWRLSGMGPRFVPTHPLDTVVLVMPLLRPLRLVHTYSVMKERRAEPRLSLYARVMTYAGLSALLLGFSASLAVYEAERGAPGTTIRTFGDAVWWACATLTTTGYGDAVPVTPRGRVVAAGLMMCGLALLGAVTGSFSSWLIQTFTREDEKRPPGR